MAMPTANPPAAPSAQVVGNAFIEQYYHILHHSPELVHRFYQDTSVLSRPDSNGLMKTVTTMKSINDIVCSLDYKNYKAEIKTADAQGSFKGGVIVLVTGCLTAKDNLKRKFTQTFFLAPQDKGYYVLNDVFRYVEESEPAIGEGVAVEDETPSSTSAQDPEPAEVVDPPKPDLPSAQVEETVDFEEKDNSQVSSDGPDRLQGDFVVEAEPHNSENNAPAAEESAAAAFQEDTEKKSYASIVSSQTKKGPTKIYVPTSTNRTSPAKTEKQPINPPPQEALEPETLANHPPVDAPENNDVQDEVEGHSIYIRNLPLNITVTQLEAEFQKFGPIKQNGVQVRSNKQQGFCFGFVEFQEFSSMQSAIKASPIHIGGRQAFVEIKRTTTRVGSGRGRFNTPRGGFRNDNFRGRGNFSNNRTYMRNDSFRGRGNFGGSRGSDGYQQGRGRGNRRPVPNQMVPSM